MQVICPHCGQPVSSDHINIQRMAAVCPACNTVFQFDLSDSAIKRRKVKQPQQLIAEESGEHLNLAFRTNFRLEQSEAFLSGVILSAAFTFITLLILVTGEVAASPVTMLVSAGFGLIALLSYYWIALVAYNKTHIEVDDEQLTVSRKPLPGFGNQGSAISLASIAKIQYEETPASKKENYDTPRFNVWADMVDGHRRGIVSDVVEDYAVFVSQRLNEFLDQNSDSLRAVSHLTDEAAEVETSQDQDEFMASLSRSSNHASHSGADLDA